ncbi:MAG TPA: S8 family peptidase [Elusimicrobiota bacterium]|nr:S8 family peptidase [Elusimicrobiota bacterium]
MKRILSAALALLAGTCVSWAQSAPRKVIVSFKPGTSIFARQQAISAMDATGVGNIESSDQARSFIAVVAEKQNGTFPAPLKSLAAASPSILSIEKDYRTKWIESEPISFETTPFPAQASLSALGLRRLVLPADSNRDFLAQEIRNRITWNVARVDAPAAWNYTQGDGVKVAVIDTGIDYTHPDLSMNVAGGYNAITGSGLRAGYKDDNGHGTHVAGIIAADGERLVGVAPHAKLYAVKVLSADGSGDLSDVIKGVIWTANEHIPVANMSLGTDKPSEALEQAVEYAAFEGTVIVAAAGNASGGPVSYPGAYPYAIAVAASDSNNKLAPFSSVGPQVAFIAPGQDILSAWLHGGYANISGTSMAAPHVTGLVALSLSQGYLGLGGPDGVLSQLQKAAHELPGVQANGEGHGFVDALKLVQ